MNRQIKPGKSNMDKPQNFSASIKKLIKSLSPFKIQMLIGIFLAIISSILVIKSPTYLSNLTNTIQQGLGVNTSNIELLTKDIITNFGSEEIKSNINKALSLNLTKYNIEFINNSDLSIKDKQEFNQFLSKIQNMQDNSELSSNQETDQNNLANINILKEILDLPDEIIPYIFKPFSVENRVITSNDRKELIRLIIELNKFASNLDINNNENAILNSKDNLFNNINFNLYISEDLSNVVFKTITIDNYEITPNDQYQFLSKLSEIKNNDDDKNENNKNDQYYILNILDQMPESIVNILKVRIDKTKLKDIVKILAIMYITAAICGYIGQILMVDVSNKFAKSLRSKVINKINNLPLHFFDKHQSGDILSIVTNDIDMIGHNLNNSLSTLITSLTLLIGSIIMMFTSNIIMALVAIVSSLIGTFGSMMIIAKSQKYFLERQVELGKLNAHIEEVYSNMIIVKSYNGREKEIKEFDQLNQKVKNANRKSQFLSGIMQPLMGFVGNLGYVCVCIAGSLLVLKGKILFGVIIAFISYVRLFTQPLSQIAQSMTNLQGVSAAGERVFEFLDEKNMPDTKATKKIDKNEVKGKVEFKDVVFTYEGNDKPTINNFSAKALPKQKIAIVGPTGAGKTTLVNLLMKFYNIDSGDILIDDISINDLSRENVHDLFTMVLQDTWIYDGTIMDNIKYNIKDVPDEKVKQVCKDIGLDHFINTLPNGYDTILNENDSVSVGQKQLITIARGIIENAPILILDEATSNVDTRTEELVQDAMDKLSKGKTSFIIAHRLSTIKNADLILVVNDGNIVEMGTHDELLKRNGHYSKLYNSQFEKDNSQVEE